MANATPAQQQKRNVYLTGFSKFDSIVENATTHIVNAIAEGASLTVAVVLEVSAEGRLLGNARPIAKKAEEPDRPCVFLRMGVDADSTKFSLEYNLADFRTPDERGWVAQNVVINADEDDALKTMLPLDEMLADLERVNANARISTDPGRYICNYVYFHSLHWVKTQDANHYALFLHVPEFELIPMDEQVQFVRRVIELVAALD
uniref:Pyroglutamyl-peptidase I n=1 Tax=Globisporangium ultimum (strain ATCC 200006 / CBS 805.95 / DAOM BR144) TaxID=431595 RepID=K3W7U5_GLOUD